MYNVGSLLAALMHRIIAYALALICDPKAVKDCTPLFWILCNKLFKKPCRAVLEADVAFADDVLAAVPAAAEAASVALAAVLAVAAVLDALPPVAPAPVNPCSRLPNDAESFAVAALAVLPAESCWIKVCNDDARLDS
jgi:hypothetical protein